MADTSTLNKHSGYKVLLGLFLLSVTMGVFAYYRYDQSEKHLTLKLHEFKALGERADVPTCINAVLDWVPQCSAMLSLCKDSVQRMMSACLIGQKRSETCAEVEPLRRKTSFGYEDCASRGLEKGKKKACADIYRAIDKYCEELSKE